MDNTELVRNGIAELEKDLSLLQISKQSGISYLTLRKIKTGETKSVSSGVAAKFEKFKNSFVPGTVTKARPGRKPKAVATPAAAAPAAAAPAKKKPGRPKKADAAPAPAAPAKKKPGRPKKTATPVKEAAASTAPVKKTATKKAAKKAAPKKKAGRPKKAAASAAPAPAAKRSDFSTPMLGEALYREIEIAQARLEYLQSLQMVEEEFLKAIGKK
jgi:hypothetical protein